MKNGYHFKVLKHIEKEIKELEPNRDTLKSPQSDLTVKGDLTIALGNKNRGTENKFKGIKILNLF